MYRVVLVSRRYTGDFVANKKHGQGTMVFHNEDRYEGQFDADERTGRGTMWYNTTIPHLTESYCGDFVKGKRCGKGVYTYADGSRWFVRAGPFVGVF